MSYLTRYRDQMLHALLDSAIRNARHELAADIRYELELRRKNAQAEFQSMMQAEVYGPSATETYREWRDSEYTYAGVTFDR